MHPTNVINNGIDRANIVDICMIKLLLLFSMANFSQQGVAFQCVAFQCFLLLQNSLHHLRHLKLPLVSEEVLGVCL